jgi:hypothetical protein
MIPLRSWHSLAHSLPFPDAGRIADEDLGRAIRRASSHKGYRVLVQEGGAPLGEAPRLRSTALAFDQRLVCSAQDWHFWQPTAIG